MSAATAAAAGAGGDAGKEKGGEDGGVEIVVRPIVEGDKAAWKELWKGYLTFYEDALPDAQYDLFFSRLLGDEPFDHSGLVAERAGKLVGLAHTVPHRHARRAENVVYLQDLYVAPEARRHGVGRKLMKAVYAAADAAGTPTVYWLTAEDNTPARSLYDSVGSVTPFIKYRR